MEALKDENQNKQTNEALKDEICSEQKEGISESHSKRANELFRLGFNCSQSVFGAFAEEYGFDLKTALQISASFGGGMGRMREVCGAFSGILMAAGMETGCTTEHDPQGKAANYKEVQELAEIFKARCGGSIICRELLGLEKAEGTFVPAKRTDEYYKKRPCPQIIEEACRIIEERYQKKEK